MNTIIDYIYDCTHFRSKTTSTILLEQAFTLACIESGLRRLNDYKLKKPATDKSGKVKVWSTEDVGYPVCRGNNEYRRKT